MGTFDLLRSVILDRRFTVRIEPFGDSFAVTVTDESDPRVGCGQLRGESGTHISVEAAIMDACTQALNDVYPQATGCGRGVKLLDRANGAWSTCALGINHEGSCRDDLGNIDRAVCKEFNAVQAEIEKLSRD